MCHSFCETSRASFLCFKFCFFPSRAVFVPFVSLHSLPNRWAGRFQFRNPSVLIHRNKVIFSSSFWRLRSWPGCFIPLNQCAPPKIEHFPVVRRGGGGGGLVAFWTSPWVKILPGMSSFSYIFCWFDSFLIFWRNCTPKQGGKNVPFSSRLFFGTVDLGDLEGEGSLAVDDHSFWTDVTGGKDFCFLSFFICSMIKKCQQTRTHRAPSLTESSGHP